MKTFFCNRTVDKGEMKRLIKWVLLNYGTEKTTRLIDQLKTLGFHSATDAGISLGIDDLRIPPIKSTFLKNADHDIVENDLRLKRGQITSVQRLEKALDIWNTTNETLKTEVVKHFRSTDLFNPVYMMAFSGARGNISQVRQLVGMRGLMADPQGQILDFPIRRNFREGLTVTEYMISCYGARKGLVDTALRTASSGYLTRRLVDVAQSVIIQQVDCQTTQGLQIRPNPKQIDSQLLGRVLFETVVEAETGRLIGAKNQEISPALALQLVKFPTLTIRSPLTCKFHAVCQLCYGWNLAQQKLVQLGEAVGVLAAQSIGEPGTQLTMRTFHTGGVFAGEATEKVYAPHSGKVFYQSHVSGRKVLSQYGETAFFTFEPLQVKIQERGNPQRARCSIFQFPPFTLLYLAPGQEISINQSLAELSRLESNTNSLQFDENLDQVKKPFFTQKSGQIYMPEAEASIGRAKKSSTELWVLGGALVKTKYLGVGDLFQAKNCLDQSKKPARPPKFLRTGRPSSPSLSSSVSSSLSSKDMKLFQTLHLSKLSNLSADQANFVRTQYLELMLAASPSRSRTAGKSLEFGTGFCKTFHFQLEKAGPKPGLSTRLNSFKKKSGLNPLMLLSAKKLTGPKLVGGEPFHALDGSTFWTSSQELPSLDFSSLKLFSESSPWKKSGTFLPNPTQICFEKFNPAFVDGKFQALSASTSSVQLGSVESKSGEVRAQNCVLTKEEETALKTRKLQGKLGDYKRVEDLLSASERVPISGQIQFVTARPSGALSVLLRKVSPYLLVPGCTLEVTQGSLVSEGSLLGTLVSAESTAGDIVQGLPKVDELLEAREPQHKLLNSMHTKLSTFFYQYGKMYGLREGCELSFQKIRQFLVQEVQDVYQSQGVYIGDKHVEIIVRQMTTHVVVIDPGKTGLLPGDIVDIRRLEQLEKDGFFAGVKYRPILLGITRAALMAESFISAASFQETKRVLAKAALEGQIDWLTGLKENVILGRLIPAGTGLY